MYSEKEIIYLLMKEIVKERRELTHQYYDLKSKLKKLEETNEQNKTSKINSLKKDVKFTSNADMERKNADYFNSTTKRKSCPFERLSGYITLILKDSPIPLSNKELYSKLLNEYEINITYPNFSNNILPKIRDSKKIPVEKAYRGYWQYRKIEDN
ncbi:hypothetical protein ACPYMZ_00360 [Enterococcus faecium]|uniref:hypothetical protein n=1 Tax=Enterococcus faecium TaxID=1352 RepID=UPI0010FC1899|nr:hypothetical protein [Enterococcus faecium]QCS45669.1 hypothetical protein FEF08_03160 [Enterococcus faecium]